MGRRLRSSVRYPVKSEPPSPRSPFSQRRIVQASPSQPETSSTAATQAGPSSEARAMDRDNDSRTDTSHGDVQEPDGTLDSIGDSHTITLSITSTYSNAWGPTEAFREIVQNWRDAIIASFKLSADQFTVVREERVRLHKTQIVYKVPHPRKPQHYLGYILFSGHDGQGIVEIANRDAILEPWHLDLGGTTKTGAINQAGAHGEGLKIALLVLQRRTQNHSVRCVTGGVEWKFDFTTRGKLVAHLRRMTRTELDREIMISRHLLGTGFIPCEIDPSKDVQLRIGELTEGRDEQGKPSRRVYVRLEEFNTWCEAAPFLQQVPDDGIVQT
ncbi:hypothetical protein B0J13DRAFT_77490 [Dactylonectria estremocensis]|uniref:Uncharacterized protein n=1 Tax=Dactylonectria estremocensis TaxID=1079267 RepID=A0A9P9EDE1_9HYPO|nr:hypothetical protein B0J13DRAFT_77490 [Dactylonectria estremocensis]